MALESSSSRSSSSADSYIGSLISLTSKSEIRYEGVLYNINTDESSIGLRNVRAFGTEGRKQDGPQFPPSDKVYEYILFRGSDIKDLQVKSSPPVQPPTQPVNNDPAIIQSHYPQVSTFPSLPSAVSGSTAVLSSQPIQFGFLGSNFQGAPPLYQPGSNLGSWGASPPPPTTNGSGLAMPMYWQGYYAPPNGLPLHQQSLLRPPPGLSMPPFMEQQQPVQYPNFNASLPGQNFPEVPSLLLPVGSSSVNSSLASLPPATLPSNSSLLPPTTLTSSLPPAHSTTIASDVLLSMIPTRIPSSILPTATSSASLPLLSSLITSTPDLSAIVPPIANMPNAVSGQTLPYHSSSQSTSSNVRASNSVHTDTPASSLVTPGQLLQSGTGTTSSSLSPEAGRNVVEVVQVFQSSSLEPSALALREAQPPLLPLPAQPHRKANGASYQNRHGYRGRERGRGSESLRPVAKFTEEFDFVAMNEKFKKEEVWGDLGKSSKSHSKNKGGDVNDSDADDCQDKDNASLPKPVYNKDDFFDSISCNTLNRDSNERTKFSERRKMDTETFGEFSRYRGGRGGRFQGGRYGRGYGYAEGRGGRGRSIPSHAS